MMQLEILTNENVLLFHFVDSVSKWSSYVSPHFRKFFDETFVTTTETTSQLAKYVDYRKSLGYDHETKLFNWAYEGFMENNEFSVLLQVLSYFKRLKDKNHNTVNFLIKNQYSYLQSYLSRFSNQDARLQIEILGTNIALKT